MSCRHCNFRGHKQYIRKHSNFRGKRLQNRNREHSGKKGHHKMIKGSIIQESIIMVDVYVPKTRLIVYMK